MVKYPNEADAATGLKMFSMAVFGTAWATINGHTPADIMPIITNTPALLNMLYVSAITTAGAIFVQSFAFRKVPATDVAMILTTEPVFAALIAAVLLGEMVNTRDIVGGGLIISACLINELNLVDKYFSSSNSGDDSSASKAAPDTNR